MNNSVKELRNNLAEKVLELGITPEFKENPAFASALVEIDGLIGQMNMFEAAESIKYSENNEGISFNFVSNTGEKHSFSLTCEKPNQFRCVKISEKEPRYIDGQLTREKSVVEEVVTLDNYGKIILDTNSAHVDDFKSKEGKCNNSTSASKKTYDSNGIMTERELKTFVRGELTQSFDRADANSILLIPREAFNGTFQNYYDSMLLVRRETLDVARVYMDDRSGEIKYSSARPLSQEQGLRDMVLLGGYDIYPLDTVISPLTPEEIESMIQKESNPKVQEGLRAYAKGRENYFYDSKEDSNFICEGIENGKSK